MSTADHLVKCQPAIMCWRDINISWDSITLRSLTEIDLSMLGISWIWSQQATNLSNSFKMLFGKTALCALSDIITCFNTRYNITSLAAWKALDWLSKMVKTWQTECKFSAKTQTIWTAACRVQGQQNLHGYWNYSILLPCQDGTSDCD